MEGINDLWNYVITGLRTDGETDMEFKMILYGLLENKKIFCDAYSFSIISDSNTCVFNPLHKYKVFIINRTL